MVLRLAGLCLLLASCVSIERNNPDDPGSANFGKESSKKSSSSKAVSSSSLATALSSSYPVAYSSSSKPSSSSIAPSSSSSSVYVGKGNDIANYKTVIIGNQMWMAENLDYNVEGSKCYSNDAANCATYGRLYDWATAMALPANCNTSTCFSQIMPKHQGICPDGWYIPTDADWDALVEYASFGGTGYDNMPGSHLKAKSGCGVDTYGFAALLGGRFMTPITMFSGSGKYGYWQSTAESNSEKNYFRVMQCDSSSVRRSDDSPNKDSKTYLMSVRCFKDIQVVYGTPVDYEGETYKTVVIGNQTWFQRNLNYEVEGSECYDANCDKYGRLYGWAMAMDLPPECDSVDCTSQVTAKHQGICPDGWHIPSEGDWGVLLKFLNPGCSGYESCGAGAGTKLRTVEGWTGGTISFRKGTDTYGFSAIPSYHDNEPYYTGGAWIGRWWSASYLFSLAITNLSEDVGVWSGGINNLVSVRCLKN